MVVLQKKKIYQQPPSKYHFEAWPLPFQAEFEQASAPPDQVIPTPPLYPLGWGWNASGRAGNTTAEALHEPHQIQKSIDNRFITAAAGKHHSLLVSEHGNVYSFGEGRKGQLGYGNSFVDKPIKGGIFQQIPRQVTPSGWCKGGRDLCMVAVACGNSFSIAREMAPSEGIDLVLGLRQMEQSLESLRSMYSESDDIQLAWANVRQERSRIKLLSEGLLTVWGSGTDGQLGLGRFIKYSPSPQIIPKLRYVSITKISAGEKHVLAISDNAHLYSWGAGTSGQLGLKDFGNRYTPEIVHFFLPYYVEDCSGGTRHSAVLTTNRTGLPRHEQERRVSCFGRGAHGRLGNGSNRSLHTPVLVEKFPLSLAATIFCGIACGGAHTLLLGYKSVPKTLANPWGTRTTVMAWGYGFNGQLGTGYTLESYYPVKVRMPKWEIIAEICAGKSWSMARTIGGALYSWGKGLRGELGYGSDVHISLAPNKVPIFTSIVKLSSGYHHNICISTPKKHLNNIISEKTSAVGDTFAPLINVDICKKRCTSQFGFNCCRRSHSLNKSHPKVRSRFFCRTCNVSSICYDCMKHCHRGHNFAQRSSNVTANDTHQGDIKILQPDTKSLLSAQLEEINLVWDEKMKKLKKLQTTSTNKEILASLRGQTVSKRVSKPKNSRAIRESKLKLLKKERRGALEKHGSKLYQVRIYLSNSILQDNSQGLTDNELDLVDSSSENLLPCCRCGLFSAECRLLPTIPEVNEQNPDPVFLHRKSAVRVIQRAARSYLNRGFLLRMTKYHKLLRYEVCSSFYFQKVLKPVWKKFDRSADEYRESRELKVMAIEDDSKHKFDYNYVAQLAVSAMDAMSYGVKILFGKSSALLPRRRGWNQGAVSSELYPSFVFSQHSLREQQMRLPSNFRLPPSVLVKYGKLFPLYDNCEGQFFDKDVSLFTGKFLRDKKTVNANLRFERGVKLLEKAKEKAKEAARHEANILRNAKKSLMTRAAIVSGAQKPPPPSKPPPRHVLSSLAVERKLESIRAAENFVHQIDTEDDSPFNMFQKHTNIPPQRRHSISDPTKIYRRIVSAGPNIKLKCFSKRRNSLPTDLKFLYPTELVAESTSSGITESLECFTLRNNIIAEYSDPTLEDIWKGVSKSAKRKGLLNVLGQAWLNPRLPCEMNYILRDGLRRRSIAEPERIAQQIEVMFDIRNCLEELRLKTEEKDNFCPRRRSFDMGEILDAKENITEVLGYRFEDAFVPPTYNDLRKDSVIMDTRIFNAGLYRPSLSGGASRNISKFGAVVPSIGTDEDTSSNVPNIWQEHYSEDGKTYYYNPATNESKWDVSSESDLELCIQYQDNDGNWYWYNNATGATTWVE